MKYLKGRKRRKKILEKGSFSALIRKRCVNGPRQKLALALRAAVYCVIGGKYTMVKKVMRAKVFCKAPESEPARAPESPPRVCFPRRVTIDVEKVMVREIEKCGLKNLKSAASMHERGKDHESETKTNPNAK